MLDDVWQIMKSIGIFTVVAQVILHFCAGEEYEKYAKVLMSIMLVTMLIMPIYQAVDEHIFEEYAQKLQDCSEEFYLETITYSEPEDASTIKEEITTQDVSVQIETIDIQLNSEGESDGE